MISYLCLYLVLVFVLGDGSDCGDAYSQTRLVLANKKTSSTPFKPTLVQRLMSPEEKQCIQKCSSFQACLDLLPQFLRKTHWPITHFGPRLENWTRLGYHTYIYYFLFEMKFEQNHWNHYQSLAFLERTWSCQKLRKNPTIPKTFNCLSQIILSPIILEVENGCSWKGNYYSDNTHVSLLWEYESRVFYLLATHRLHVLQDTSGTKWFQLSD